MYQCQLLGFDKCTAAMEDGNGERNWGDGTREFSALSLQLFYTKPKMILKSKVSFQKVY